MYTASGTTAAAAAGGLAYTGVAGVWPTFWSALLLIILGVGLLLNGARRSRKEAKSAGM